MRLRALTMALMLMQGFCFAQTAGKKLEAAPDFSKFRQFFATGPALTEAQVDPQRGPVVDQVVEDEAPQPLLEPEGGSKTRPSMAVSMRKPRLSGSEGDS